MTLRGSAAGVAARPVPSRTMLCWFIAGVAAVKLAILAAVGPSIMLDSELYVAFADTIRAGQAFAPVPFVADPIPWLIFRTAGYPLVLAVAKLVAPGFWAALAVMFQGALDIAAMVLMFRVAERLLGSDRWALLAVLAYACSRSLLWDNAVMSDSLYASFFNIVMFALLGGLLDCWRLSAWKIAGLAALWGYSLWTRDNGLYFTFLPLLLLVVAALRRPVDWRRLSAPLGFAAIVAAMISGYSLYNLHRTGGAFFSLTGADNYLRPLFDMRLRGYADPFAGDDLIDRTVRETMTAYDYSQQQQFIAILGERCGCTPTQLQSMVVEKFVREVQRHPLAYLRVVLRNFAYFDLASDLFDPINTFNDFVQEGTPFATRVIPGFSIRHLVLTGQYSAAMIALMVIAGITKLLSAALFTLFVVGIPVLWLRDWRRGGPMGSKLWGVGFLWFAFASVTGAFSLIHFEARHALPVFPAAQIGTVFVLATLARAYRRPPQVKTELSP